MKSLIKYYVGIIFRVWWSQRTIYHCSNNSTEKRKIKVMNFAETFRILKKCYTVSLFLSPSIPYDTFKRILAIILQHMKTCFSSTILRMRLNPRHLLHSPITTHLTSHDLLMPAKINAILSGFRRPFFGMAPKLLMGLGKHRLTSFMLSIFLKRKGGMLRILKPFYFLSYLKQLLETKKQRFYDNKTTFRPHDCFEGGFISVFCFAVTRCSRNFVWNFWCKH